MKNTFFLLVLSILLFSSCKKEKAFVTIDCVPMNLQSNLIAFYPFQDGSLEDKSLQTNDLTNPTQAIPTIDRNGNNKCAYRFDNGQTDLQFLKTEQTDFLNDLPVFSISLWYQPLDISRPGGNYEPLLYRGEDAFNQAPIHENWDKKEWSVALYDCRKALFTHRSSVWANPAFLNNYPTCEDIVSYFTGRWQHLVVVWSGETVKIYQDGIFRGETIGNGQSDNLVGVGDLFIGKNYTGEIDDIMIFDKELSQQEVTELFNLEACCGG